MRVLMTGYPTARSFNDVVVTLKQKSIGVKMLGNDPGGEAGGHDGDLLMSVDLVFEWAKIGKV